MSLVLEIEFLTGVCRAARGPASEAPDWPPEPDRVFSALVAAWAVRGKDADERAALEWLETAPPPAIRASPATARSAPDVFVPPNDARSSSAAATYLKVLPERRPRQPRRFPVAHPDDPAMALVWEDAPAPLIVAALDALARDVPYVGHSASLTRCHFRVDANAGELETRPARRRVYPGRLSELERTHCENPVRPVIREGAAVAPSVKPLEKSTEGWLVLEAIGGEMPDIRAAAIVCRELRRALMSGYARAGLGEAIPELVSGHASERTPSRMPHVAIQPMAFAGSPHADGRIFGFALIPPTDVSLIDVPGLRAAFEAVAPYDAGEERRVLTLAPSRESPLRAPLLLAPAGVAAKRSLSPAPYLREARVWGSVTPIVLDRHLKQNDEAEVRALLARACENAGLPRPEEMGIQVGKHSAVEGAPPARPLRGAPRWTRWRVPKFLASRALTHAVIDFGRPVAGPILLGAGRFTGLGLCRPLES